MPADDTAASVAGDFSVDLSSHGAIDLTDFAVRDGDLCLLMEQRHIAPVAAATAGQSVQIVLLGLWCRPRFPLLYDPHTLGRPNFVTCFDRIGRAVTRLVDHA